MNKANYKPLVRSYVLSVLSDEDHNIDQPTEQQLFTYAKDRFFSEYGWAVKRLGLQGAIKEWLLGLAIGIDYTYFDIEQRLKSWGIVNGNETEKQLDKKLEQYWDRVAMALYTEFNKGV